MLTSIEAQIKAAIQPQIDKANVAMMNGLTKAGEANYERLTQHFSSKSKPEIEVIVSKDGLKGEVNMIGQIISWMNEGTGIYGPRGTRITPKSAPVLRFKVGDGPRGTKPGSFDSSPSPTPTKWVSAKSVEGQKAGEWDEAQVKFFEQNGGRIAENAARKVLE